MSNRAAHFLAWFIVGTLLVAGIWGSYTEEKAWQAYSHINHCHSVGKRAGQLGYMYGGRMSYAPEQTIYACDKGEFLIK